MTLEQLEQNNPPLYLQYVNVIAFKTLHEHYVKTVSALTGKPTEEILKELSEIQGEIAKEVLANIPGSKQKENGSN